MPMEPDLYRALRAKDLRRVRECLCDWGNENRRVWWTGSQRALTPLHVASKGSSQDIVAELLKHREIGLAINSYTDKASETPLHVAAGSSSPAVIRLLLDAGADITAPSGDGSSPLHLACSRGRLETCVELFRRGSLLEGRDADGRTPLLRAAANGRADVTKWLLSEGADPAAVDLKRNTALALSCRATGLDPARALLDSGADVIAENAEGNCCVQLAAVSGRTELLDMMLTAMANSGQRLRDGGGCMLYDVVDHGLDKVVELLTSSRGRELGVNVNRSNPEKQGTTPLHAAVFRGQHGIVCQLLSRGADPNVTDDNELRAMHVACASPDSQPMVRALLKAKGDANVLDVFGCAPIYYAFVRGNDDLVRYMLSRGASLFKMDYDQGLRIACFYGMILEVESLLWMEADASTVLLNTRDRGSAFHASVNPAVRDGINELLAESSDECGGSGGGGDGTGGGNGVAAAVAREAAAALSAAQACVSPSGTLASDSSGWTSSGDSSIVVPGYQSSAGSSTESDVGGGGGGDLPGDTRVSRPREDRASCDRFGRQSFGLAYYEAGADDDEDLDDMEAFVVPSLLSLENDLIRERDNTGGGNSSYADGSTVSSAASVMRRWGARVLGAASTSNNNSSSRPAAEKENTAAVAAVAVLQKVPPGPGVRERARAKFADVIKWASSPRARKGGVVAG